MSRRILRDQDVRPVRKDLGDGDWVDLKSRFRVRDRGAINGAIVSGEITTHTAQGIDGKKTQTVSLGSLNLDATNIAWLAQGVLRWGGPGFCTVDHDAEGAPSHVEVEDSAGPCRSLPVTVEALGNLDDATGLLIVHWLQELNPEPKEDSPNP